MNLKIHYKFMFTRTMANKLGQQKGSKKPFQFGLILKIFMSLIKYYHFLAAKNVVTKLERERLQFSNSVQAITCRC